MRSRVRWDVKNAGRDGDDLKFLIRLKKKGREVPLLDEREKVPEQYIGVWQAFIQLSGSRRGAGLPICMTDILAYFEMVGIDHFESREVYLYAILDLDVTINAALAESNRKHHEAERRKNGSND